MATKPTKIEIAQFEVMNDQGLSPHAIGGKMGRDPKTIRKYLQSEVYNDPEVASLVAIIKEKELADLCLLGGKARQRLHELLDEGKTKAIETTAVMDRVFQQRRLLEGESTENVAHLHSIIATIKGHTPGKVEE